MEVRLKKNVFLKAVEAVVTIALSFLQLAVITRMYSPSEVGEYQLTFAWIFIVSALSCFGGIVMISTREMTHCNEEDRKVFFSSAVALQIMVTVPLGVAALLYLNWASPRIAAPLSLGIAITLGATILQLSQAVLVSKERISSVARVTIIAQIISTIALVFAALNHASITVLVAMWATCNLIQGLMLFFISRAWRMLSFSLVDSAVIRGFSREVLPVLIMIIATHLYVRIDVIMLSYFTSESVVAQYGAGYLFLDQLMILSHLMIGALFPNFARAAVDSNEDFRVLYQGILMIFCKYLFPIAFLIAIFAKPLLGVVYGQEYAIAWPSLSILMIAAVCAWINGPSGTIFISLKKQHIYMWATLLSLLVNVLGNVLLIPIFGAVGAAISTVLTELAICLFCLYWIHKQTGYLPFHWHD